MSKRFTDTTKYKKPFIRSLKGAYKLFWDYLYHDCDHAGIWIVDFEIAQIYIGKDMPINYTDAIKYFNKDEQRIIEIENGKKWFIPSFIIFQYGELTVSNRAHNSVIQILDRYHLLDNNKHLLCPLQGAKDKDKDKDMDKDKERDKEKDRDKDKEKIIKEEIKIKKPKVPDIDSKAEIQNKIVEYLLPKSPDFRVAFNEYVQMRVQIKKPIRTIRTLTDRIRELEQHSNGSEELAIKILNQSVDSSWQGIFQLKSDNNNNQGTVSLQETRDRLTDELKKDGWLNDG